MARHRVTFQQFQVVEYGPDRYQAIYALSTHGELFVTTDKKDKNGQMIWTQIEAPADPYDVPPTGDGK